MTPLQEMFRKRLAEELGTRSTYDVSRTAAAKGYKIGKSTVARILLGKQDPSLDVVYILCEVVLGVPPWVLMAEADQIEQRVIRPPVKSVTNIVRMPKEDPVFRGRREDKKSRKSAR